MTAWTLPGRWPRFPERTLAGAVRLLLVLVLATPLVVGIDVIYPFVTGKALYARVLIALAFAAWAVLALERPAWRPPRSPLLVLVGAGVLVAAVAAAFGVSPRRSVWSNYGRMEGLLDLAHWAAFAVMAASTFRTRRDWAWVLGFGLAVGLAAAAAALAQALAPGLLPLRALRPGEQAYGTLGNPAYLGAAMQATALLAAGCLAASLARRPPEPELAPMPRAARRRLRRAAAPAAPRASAWRHAPSVGAGLVLGASLAALGVSGSMGATVGLIAGSACTLLLLAACARDRRARIAGIAAIAVLAAVPATLGGVLAWRAAAGEARAAPVFGVRVLDRLTSPHDLKVSMGSRFDNWRAGIGAFADRPLLGWGPGNYLAASGRHLAADYARHLPSKGTVNEGQDHAHNVTMEVAATQGLAGLAAYLALWAWTAVVAVRAARRATGTERVMVACVGGVLAGWFVQSQTLFYFTSAWLVHTLLIAFLVGHEAALRRGAPETGRAGLSGGAVAGGRGAALGRLAAGAAALALTAGSLAANHGIHAGAAALHRAETGTTDGFMAELEASIAAFEPLATHNRILLFENVAPNWPVLRARHPDEAFRLLAWCDRAAPKALAAEPHNWQLHHALAHLYREVARTEPEYAERAERHARAAREVAPNLDPTRPLNYMRGGGERR